MDGLKRVICLLLAGSGVTIPALADTSSDAAYEEICRKIVYGETIEDMSIIPTIPYADLMKYIGKTVVAEYPFRPGGRQAGTEGQME